MVNVGVKHANVSCPYGLCNLPLNLKKYERNFVFKNVTTTKCTIFNHIYLILMVSVQPETTFYFTNEINKGFSSETSIN